MAEIIALLAGKARPFHGAETSAIAKAPLSGRVTIGPLGIVGDEQADLRFHGGPDKAVHHYPADHYAFWRATLGDHPLLSAPGGFGENVSTIGLDEHSVHLGDRFRLGTALVEVSHGRQPCWKISHRFDMPTLTARVVKTGRAGWYYRVIEEGTAEAGDALELVERGLTDWPLARLFDVLVAGGHKREKAALADLAAAPVLAEAWRSRARDLAG